MHLLVSGLSVNNLPELLDQMSAILLTSSNYVNGESVDTELTYFADFLFSCTNEFFKVSLVKAIHF